MANKCEQGYKGNCCCNCTYQWTLFKAPTNSDTPEFFGSITEETGLYACPIVGMMDEINHATISDRIHGCCEMHKHKAQLGLDVEGFIGWQLLEVQHGKQTRKESLEKIMSMIGDTYDSKK